MFQLRNPIPQQIRDTERQRSFYRKFDLVPYVGFDKWTAHKFLQILTDLPDLSATHGNCISDLTKWCFNGDLDFVTSTVPGLKQEAGEISEGEKVRLAREFEKYGVSIVQIRNTTKKLFQARKKTGDYYLRYKEIQVGGTKRIFLEALPPSNVMYLNTKENEPKTVVISKDFLYSDAFTEEPKLIRVYPDFSGTATERETVIHVKTEDEENLWYGRPDTIQALYWMATEWFQALHSLKVTKTETVAKAILAMMNPDPNSLGQGENVTAVMKENRVQINRLMTNKGHEEVVDSIGVVGYPYEGKEPTLLKLDINRDAAFFAANVKMASDYITAAHGWDKTLLGFERPSSGIGGNVLIDTFEVKNTSTIKPLQQEYEAEPWGTVFRLAAEFTGVQDFAGIAPRFDDRVKSLIESMSERQKSNGIKQDTNNGNGSQGAGEGEQGNSPA